MRYLTPIVAALLASAPAFSQQVIVKIDGSSTVFPITEAVAEDFQKEKKQQVKVTVGISGTGGGFKKFCRGETDISGASRPILKVEMEQCRKAGVEYFELPVAFDGLSVVVHQDNTFCTCLTVADLRGLWRPESEGDRSTWRALRPDWPARPIHLLAPGRDSGTFDYFTTAIVGNGVARQLFTDDHRLVALARAVN